MNDVDALRRRREEERLATLWQGRLQQLQRDFTDREPEIEAAVSQVENCLQLWRQAQQEVGGGRETEQEEEVGGGTEEQIEDRAVLEALVDQHREWSRRWLPMVKKWIDTLTKAGRGTDHNMLR